MSSPSQQSIKGKGKTNLRPSKALGSEFDEKPLWNHVKVLSLPVRGGGNRTWSCNYYNKKVTGSYSIVKGHLLKIPNQGVEACKSINNDEFQALKKEHGHSESKKAQEELNVRKKEDYLSLPEGSDLLQCKKRRASAPGVLENAFNVTQRDVADKQAARMFYASGLSFNLARCPHFRKYSLTLANSKLSGYTPPTFDRLRTTLLAQEKAHVNRKLQPIKDTWKKKAMSLCSDGWSDRQRRPLINIMAASVGGAMFLKAVDASGNIKDADYVANLFKPVIQEVGSQNVVQVITDNGSNFKAARAIIEGIYPHIFWTPCVVHCLNLALKSICEPSENSPQFAECKWIADLVSSVQNIRNFIVNHGMVLSIFNNYSELGLLRVAETRFASSIIMAKRMREVNDALEKMVMDPSWRMHLKWDGKSAIKIKAREVKISIVSDSWWADLEYLLDFTEPIVEFLRLADTDAPVLHLIYDMWDTMIEKVKSRIFGHEKQDVLTGQSNFFDVIHNILETRRNKSNNPLH
ncbi:uncharacterized protein LOC132281975 [Cornus florida]|uniref:uncharacterized protein LOC132281975 n=1 Tax=Cornus florida TaxID=4283 RepID=UPI002899FBBE|nr:uncharacterized protein LOC132281975 [Cornus florida]